MAYGALQGSVEVIYICSLEVPLSPQPTGMSQMADREGLLNPNIWSDVTTIRKQSELCFIRVGDAPARTSTPSVSGTIILKF